MSRALQLTEQLIARPSVTPDDGGCQALLRERLEAVGFACETLVFGPSEAPVTNLWAIRRGRDAAAPVLVFAGHTDVVPTGPLAQWTSDPFVPTHRDGVLYGRGAADMKTSIAAMVVAIEEFVAAHPGHTGSVALLITSDEEGPSVDGTVKVCEWLTARGQRLDYCIVGEPSSVEHLGDMIKNGRRGSLSAKLAIQGVQGHIAYPHLAKNPIHLAMPALAELAAIEWDHGNAYFPPTSWQMSNIHAGTGANNVIPGELRVLFNLRFNPNWRAAQLEQECEAVLRAHGLEYDVHWHRGGEPFHTPEGPLRAAAREVLAKFSGGIPEESTGGGTSDARFIAPLGAQCIEIGPVNASIHKVDEHVAVADLEVLPDLYFELIERLLVL